MGISLTWFVLFLGDAVLQPRKRLGCVCSGWALRGVNLNDLPILLSSWECQSKQVTLQLVRLGDRSNNKKGLNLTPTNSLVRPGCQLKSNPCISSTRRIYPFIYRVENVYSNMASKSWKGSTWNLFKCWVLNWTAGLDWLIILHLVRLGITAGLMTRMDRI